MSRESTRNTRATSIVAERLARIVAELEQLQADVSHPEYGGTAGNINMALSSLNASLTWLNRSRTTG